MFVLAGPVDRRERVRGGEQRVARCAADRLDEHGAADALRGPRGEGEVLGGERVLLVGRAVVGAVAVERVERPAAQPFADADRDVDVVAELGAAGGPGDQAAVAAGHVAGEEVQPDQLHSGVGDRAGEGVDVGVRRDGDGPGPPELDRVEPGLLRGRRPFEQREFGEQDRQVDLEPHLALIFRNVETIFRLAKTVGLDCRAVNRLLGLLTMGDRPLGDQPDLTGVNPAVIGGIGMLIPPGESFGSTGD